MTLRALASLSVLLTSAPAAAQPHKVPVLKVDSAVFWNDIVVTGTPIATPTLAISETVSSPPVAVADVTAGLVTGTAAEAGNAAAARQADAELARITRATRLYR